MVKNITDEIEKLAVIEKEFQVSLRTAKIIKQEFEPFRNNVKEIILLRNSIIQILTIIMCACVSN